MISREHQEAFTHMTSAALGRMAGIPVVHLAPVRALVTDARTTLQRCPELVESARATDKSWVSTLIKEHRRLRLALLYLAPGTRLPIHDHPCNIGVMELLEGRAVVELFERGEKRPRRRTVPMTRKARLVLDPGDRAEIGPAGPNLHGISSEDGAVLVSAVYSSNGQWTRHWYLPITDEGTHVNALILNDPIEAVNYPERREASSRGRQIEPTPAAGQTAAGTRRRLTQRKRNVGRRLRT